MIRINFLLRNPKKKGKTAIYATVRYRGKVVILFPRESIDTFMWINKNGINKLKPIAENATLKGRLEDFERDVRLVYNDLQKSIQGVVPPEVLKKTVYDKLFPPEVKVEEKNKDTRVFITDFFQTLIDDSKNHDRRTNYDLDLNPNSIKPYKSAMNHFIKFQEIQRKEYFLTDITQKLIKDFSDYLNTILALNTSAKYLTVFKLLISYATEKKLIDYNMVASVKVIVRREKSDNIYLTELEIKEMMAIKEFPTKLYEVVRDYLIISCNTGLRFSDFSDLNLGNFIDGFLETTQDKTLGDVIVPLHSMVKQILAKYPNGLPQCPPNQVCNRYLKEIAKRIPSMNNQFEKKTTRSHKVERKMHMRWNLIQTHSGRRSFCTNLYLKNVPILTIMALSGHKTPESFLKYIKADNRKHADIVKKIFDEEEKKQIEEDEKRREEEEKKKQDEKEEDCDGVTA